MRPPGTLACSLIGMLLLRLRMGWYVLGYSPSSWSSLAGSLWNEKSAHVWTRELMAHVWDKFNAPADNAHIYWVSLTL
jgi:hypothetical protein